jgi:hypothetical protein
VCYKETNPHASQCFESKGDGCWFGVFIGALVTLLFLSYSTCAWGEVGKNMPMLMELVSAQISAGIVPAVAPFHSLHYPFPKTMVTCTASTSASC